MPTAVRASTATMVRVEGGRFLMGSDDALSYPDDSEGPVREATLPAFRIDACAVSNADFAAFVAETGYISEAERFGSSLVFGGLLPDDFPPTQAVASAPWWRLVERADWAHPEGPQSDVGDRQAHPVVHVSHADASAVCAWAGTRLPTEPEWEYAARGGLVGQPFPWGAELEPGGRHRMNVFQGRFPGHNTAADGWHGTCPVDAFPPNGYGLQHDRQCVGVVRRGLRPATPRPPTDPRRLLPVPRLVLPALPRLRTARTSPGLLDRQHRLPLRARRLTSRCLRPRRLQSQADSRDRERQDVVEWFDIETCLNGCTDD